MLFATHHEIRPHRHCRRLTVLQPRETVNSFGEVALRDRFLTVLLSPADDLSDAQATRGITIMVIRVDPMSVHAKGVRPSAD